MNTLRGRASLLSGPRAKDPRGVQEDEDERVFSADTSGPRALTSLVRRPCVWRIVVPCLVVLHIQMVEVPVDRISSADKQRYSSDRLLQSGR